MRIGSITKTLTGTAVLQLVDQGKLHLDDPVSKYVPGVPNGAQITLRELLNMTSGLYNYSLDPAFNHTLDSDMGKVWAPEELLAIAFSHPPDFAPGKGWEYSNTNFILLGMIVERVTGRPVEEVLSDAIFNPLGMTNSLLPPRTSAAIPDPHPHGYLYSSNAADIHCQPATAAQLGAPHDVTNANPSWGWTAGAGISTLHDLRIWARALATGTLLSAATQRERLQWVPGNLPGLPSASGVHYGLAIADIDGFLGHNGDLPGFQSFMGYSPAKDATIIVLTNLYLAPDCTGPADDIARLIITQLFSK
jgi:D-alanyl-D-alanine carboxypeptidase